jgi:hypothetical protein
MALFVIGSLSNKRPELLNQRTGLLVAGLEGKVVSSMVPSIIHNFVQASLADEVSYRFSHTLVMAENVYTK